MPTFGIEEEVFITEPERPTLRSLYYLAKLLARDPAFYYTHSAHNFARGKDLKQGMMSGVEISTGMHEDVDAILADLESRRADLAAVSSGLIVPVGHLLNYDTPTNTCALHVHVGGVPDKERVYRNMIHFLPALLLITINSPMAGGGYFGQSYRIAKSWAIGAIKDDPTIRFQDVILSKRLGTVELRACDVCWDLSRVRLLLKAVEAIAGLREDLDPNMQTYNSLRPEIARRGLIEETLPVAEELAGLVGVPLEALTRTASDELWEMYQSSGLIGAYSALDNGYRSGAFEPRTVEQKQRSGIAAGIVGFAAYFVPRLPYYALKGILEN